MHLRTSDFQAGTLSLLYSWTDFHGDNRLDRIRRQSLIRLSQGFLYKVRLLVNFSIFPNAIFSMIYFPKGDADSELSAKKKRWFIPICHILFKQPLFEIRLDPAVAKAGDKQKLLVFRRD